MREKTFIFSAFKVNGANIYIWKNQNQIVIIITQEKKTKQSTNDKTRCSYIMHWSHWFTSKNIINLLYETGLETNHKFA